MSPPGTTGRAAPAARTQDPRATPAMRQYARFKAQHPDCVLFFRMGDFYEMFDDDAVVAHRTLGITLTQRTEGVPMAGVPYHAVESYLRRMIEAGHRVAVCDQVQDPREARGVVERAVTRVITPGTLVDEGLLDEARSNHVAAIRLEDDPAAPAALAVIEVSTGAFSLVEISPPRLLDEMVRIGPSELLYAETADGGTPESIEAVRAAAGCAVTPRPAWQFAPDDGRDALLRQFGVTTLAGFGLDDDDAALGPAGAVLRYLLETQATGGTSAESALAHLAPPRREAPDDCVVIDAVTLRNLEIEQTMRRRTAAGSLLSVFGRLHTGMGKRRLRQWLCFPLRDAEAIRRRHDAVAALREDRALAEALGGELREVQDVARITGRIALRRATPRDLVALGRSVAKLPALSALLADRPALAPASSRLERLAEPLARLAGTIGERCVEDPPPHLRDGGLIRDGVDAELDEARSLQRDATGWLARYQKSLIEESGINSLKVGYNKVFGYYIEVTHAHVDRIPDGFSRKQTLKNAERYITPQLKTFEDRVTTAQAEAVEREKVLFEALCREAAGEAKALGAFADVAGELDVLLCYTETARRCGYCRPEMVEAPCLLIRGGRHPVLDRTLAERFVPNDCRLGDAGDETGEPGASLALITGPNMAGKSTFIRQVALLVLLAHAGSFVPAESATIGLTDRIFTRIGASDELHAGRSTFMVEMTEAANILHHATARSVVILDEIGRGTSTLDGLSLAWAIAEALADRGCRTLFATHYHELTDLSDGRRDVANFHVAVREWGEEIIFLYRIQPGRTDRSYGIHVARIAGLPREAIARAEAVLETLAVQTERRAPAGRPAGGQLPLFTEYLPHPVVEQLRALDLDALSPLEAFDALRRLRGQLEGH